MYVREFLKLAEKIKETHKGEFDEIAVVIFDKQAVEDLFEDVSIPKFELTHDRMAHIAERIEEVANVSLDNELYDILKEASEITDDDE